MRISYNVIGHNIRKARTSIGFTQEKNAELLQMSALHFGRLERGERRASLDQLAKICDVLNTSLEEILWGVAFSANTAPSDCTLGYAIDSLSAGCSSDTLRLMLDFCRLAAAHDKFPSTKP